MKSTLALSHVDDYFDCADTDEAVIELAQRIIKVHDHGGFKLVKFSSNSRAVLESLEPEIVADKENNVRVLGIKWELSSDELVFPLDFPKLQDSEKINYRGATIQRCHYLVMLSCTLFATLVTRLMHA